MKTQSQALNILLGVTLAGIVACSTKPNSASSPAPTVTTETTAPGTPVPAAQGGSSDGTGDLFLANDKDIEGALQTANLLLMDASSDFMMAPPYGVIDGGKILPKDLEYVVGLEFIENTTLLMLNRVKLLKTGLCKDPYGNEGTASVITVDGKPNICLAVQVLKSLPADYLPEHLAALFAHEITHILGKDEVMANRAQKWFASYIKIRLELARFSSPYSQPAMLRSVLNSIEKLLDIDPNYNICQSYDNIINMADQVDKEIYNTRYTLRDFGIEFPTANKKEYWMRKTADALYGPCKGSPNQAKLKENAIKLAAEYDLFISQFGKTWPRELRN